MTARGEIRSVAPLTLNLRTRWNRAISFNIPDVSTTRKGALQNLLFKRLGVPTAGVYVLEKGNP
jgi:hypothetical protein